MLCEIGQYGGFFIVWVSMTVLAFISMMILSTIIFIPYYARPTFEFWFYKCNPSYPSASLIKKEIIQMTKGKMYFNNVYLFFNII
jgi:hypothetical protein